MFAFLLNTFIFALVISLLFTGVHYLYLKVMNQDDEYTRNEYIMFFVKYYVISLTSLMGYQFLNDYLKTNNKGSSEGSAKNVMFGGSNITNTTSFSNNTNSASAPASNSVNTTAFKPVSNNTQVTRPNVSQPNYESFKTGRPTF